MNINENKCPAGGCIKQKPNGKWGVISGKTGKFWDADYDSEKDAKEGLKGYFANENKIQFNNIIENVIKKTIKQLNEDFPSNTHSLNHNNPTDITNALETIVKAVDNAKIWLEEGNVTSVNGALLTIREIALDLYTNKLGGEGAFY